MTGKLIGVFYVVFDPCDKILQAVFFAFRDDLIFSSGIIIKPTLNTETVSRFHAVESETVGGIGFAEPDF